MTIKRYNCRRTDFELDVVPAVYLSNIIIAQNVMFSLIKKSMQMRKNLSVNMCQRNKRGKINRKNVFHYDVSILEVNYTHIATNY